MTAFVALLRSVNLAKTSRMTMADLRAAVAGLGLAEVRTIAHTGNILFEADGGAAALEQAIHAAIEEAFGFNTEVFVRDAAGFAALIEHNPFPDYARADPAHLLAMVMRQAPPAEAVAAARAAIVGREEIAAVGADVYLWYPDAIGPSKFTGALIERRLGAPGTTRNWNTVLKIAAAFD
jgi:uncharacterized protein (DUF1697 family)